MRKLLAIAYGCWSDGKRFKPAYEKRLKAPWAEKKSHRHRTNHGPWLRFTGPGLPKTGLQKSKEKKEGHLTREERQPFDAWSRGHFYTVLLQVVPCIRAARFARRAKLTGEIEGIFGPK
jgi:hypothetical protein